MTKEDVRDRIMDVGIVPVVRASSPQLAIAAAHAVCAGGIPIVEVTMTVPNAIDVIQELIQTMDHRVLIGAGTVLDAATALQCLEAGAEFLVSTWQAHDGGRADSQRNCCRLEGRVRLREGFSVRKRRRRQLYQSTQVRVAADPYGADWRREPRQRRSVPGSGRFCSRRWQRVNFKFSSQVR
jgi:hypothetical protein